MLGIHWHEVVESQLSTDLLYQAVWHLSCHPDLLVHLEAESVMPSGGLARLTFSWNPTQLAC